MRLALVPTKEAALLNTPNLLSESNAKTDKSVAHGWLTWSLQLAPAAASGRNVCPDHTVSCAAGCVAWAGRGRMSLPARLRRTQRFFDEPERFFDELLWDLGTLTRSAARQGLRPAVRLNAFSDLPWERFSTREGPLLGSIAELGITPYDYTKSLARALDQPYNLTFSWSLKAHADAIFALEQYVNVAVVFDTRRGDPLPATWHGFPVLDGDVHDLRFLDPVGHVVGLRAKGPLRAVEPGKTLPPQGSRLDLGPVVDWAEDFIYPSTGGSDWALAPASASSSPTAR